MHDWILERVVFDWEAGRVTFELGPYDPVNYSFGDSAQLIAENVSVLKCPRRHEWGPSASILEATQSRDAETVQLRSQMQSDDLIEVEASSLKLPAGVCLA